jgi:hypothetical protein
MPHTSTYYWDYAHVNSIDPGPGGQLLISSRSTWAVFDVDMHTGGFLWRIGGKYSSFKRGPGTKFYWQHDAAWQPGGLVSVFDNGSTPPEEKQSRGLLLDPNTTTKTVTLVKQFTNPNTTLLASSQGDLLNLGDGNWLMGYGGLPDLTEYSNTGQVLLNATLGPDVQDFRTYLAPWTAAPTTRPTITAQTTNSTTTIQASWNGATAATTWKVLAGTTPNHLTTLTTTPHTTFQTTIQTQTTDRYIAIAALNSQGQTLATSKTITPTRSQ